MVILTSALRGRLGTVSRLWRRSPGLPDLGFEAVGPLLFPGELFTQRALGSGRELYLSFSSPELVLEVLRDLEQLRPK